MYSLKRELKLNNKEVSLMRGCSGFKRWVYNWALKLVKASWVFKDIKASDSFRLDAAKKVFTNQVMHKPEYAWMKEYPSTIYQSAFQDLKEAFSRWRKGLAEMPMFKQKKKGDSFTVYKTAGIYPEKGKPPLPFTNRTVVSGKKIQLPGLKRILRIKEPIPYICASQTFTVSRSAEKWFVSFALDAEKLPPLFHPKGKVGIDLGVKAFATLSDGTVIDSPNPMRKAKTKLGKLQWRNRNKQLGNSRLGIRKSKKAGKYYIELARQHNRISNQRQDFLHKTTTEIAKTYSVVRIEDLNVQGMIANHKLALAVSDCGFYEFRRQLDYKQAHYGHRVETVDRWFPSSKTCSNCNHIQPMPLRERVFKCQKCSFEIDRDLNASINLENAPDEKVTVSIGRATPESNACGQEGADTLGRNRKKTSKKSRIG
jgi:putative transposase